MSTTSLSADPRFSLLLAKNIASQMAFSSVWLFHLYGFFTCMGFSSVGFYLWVSSVGFICGFYLWVLSVGFICGFYLWVLSVGFICPFCEACGRSMRAKHFFDETIIIRIFFCYATLVFIII
jgi:hypothetical protein